MPHPPYPEGRLAAPPELFVDFAADWNQDQRDLRDRPAASQQRPHSIADQEVVDEIATQPLDEPSRDSRRG